MSFDLTKHSVTDLFNLYGEIFRELKRRKIIRTSNALAGDYAEYLFCKAFGWTQEKNSNAGYDAIDSSGIKYQIKGRRLTPDNKSRQLGAIRKLAEEEFDYLAVILFDEYMTVFRAVIMPHSVVVAQNPRYVENTNSWTFLLTDRRCGLDGVEDVTSRIREAADQVGQSIEVELQEALLSEP